MAWQNLARDAQMPCAEHLKRRIVRFVGSASTEIIPGDETNLAELSEYLAAGTDIYVAHTPGASLRDVVRTALAVQRAGFSAMPHIAARRIANSLALRQALQELRSGGVQQILLVAGDAARPTGEFSSTLDVIDSGALEEAQLRRIGVAGHPEGHKAVGPTLLWEALEAKQAFAKQAGIPMHIVTQFGFDANAVLDWGQQLPRHQIQLPVHVGIAGPAPLSRLIHFAMKCGIGVSLRTVIHSLSAIGSVTKLASSPDHHLLRLAEAEGTGGLQMVAPHFYAFGGCLETARWMHRIAAGDFVTDYAARCLRIYR